LNQTKRLNQAKRSARCDCPRVRCTGITPEELDVADDVGKAGLSCGNLPCPEAGAQAGLSANGGRANAAGPLNIGIGCPNSQLFSYLSSRSEDNDGSSITPSAVLDLFQMAGRPTQEQACTFTSP
jgi:hypothetical protein